MNGKVRRSADGISAIDDLFIPEPNSGCWLWFSTVSNDGYGKVQFEGRTRIAHRVAWELLKGKIPDGMEIDHLCEVRCCVNPNHLALTDRLGNTRQLRAFNREQIIEIQSKCWKGRGRAPRGVETTFSLARKFGVSRSAVYTAAHGRLKYHQFLLSSLKDLLYGR